MHMSRWRESFAEHIHMPSNSEENDQDCIYETDDDDTDKEDDVNEEEKNYEC